MYIRCRNLLALAVSVCALIPAHFVSAQTYNCSNPPSGTKPTLGFMLNKGAYLTGLNNITTSADGTPAHSGSFLASWFFNRSVSILFTNTIGSNPVPSGWVSRGGLKDASYADLTANEVAIGNTPSISVIIYDNESWSQTPSSEQTTPAATTASFVGWAHNHFTTRYTAMATPARDLASVQSDYIAADGIDDYYLNVQPPYSGTGTNRPFANFGSDADIFEVQAQAHTTDGTYASFVSTAASQATSNRSGVQLWAGVSTVYGTDSQMCDAVISTYQVSGMSGYWLNFSSSPTTTEYQQAVNFLNLLYNDGF
jgi:hypothetical protein